MITSLDILNWLYSALKDTVGNNGGLYKLTKPSNSDKEDIVINTLPITGFTVQTGVANVNIYVPDMKVMINGTHQNQPDTNRLKTLSDKVLSELHDYISNDTIFFVEAQQVIKEENNFHFMNLRLGFNKHNSKS